MLKSAEIIQYRSCANVRVDEINNLLVLLGKNGAGKSNVMKAIEWAAKNACSVSISEADKCFKTTNGEVRLTFEIDHITYSYYIKRNNGLVRPEDTTFVELLEASNPEHEILHTVFSREGESLKVPVHQKDYEVSDEIPSIFAISLLLPDGDQLKKNLTQISEFLGSFKYFSLEQHSSAANYVFTREDEFQKWLNSKENKAAQFPKIPIYKILDLYFNDQDAFQELSSLLGPDGLDIIRYIGIRKFDLSQPDSSQESNKADTLYIVHFCPAGHENLFSFDDLSFGTKRIIEFVLSLVYDTYSVALVEQIEDGIHEGLIYKLIELIRSYSENSQFVLTSHSSSVFNSLSPEEVRLVELSKGVTDVKKLTVEQIDAAKEYMAEEGSFADIIGAF